MNEMEKEKEQRMKNERKLQEELFQLISNSIIEEIPKQIEISVNENIKNVILPKIEKAIINYGKQEMLKPTQEKINNNIEKTMRNIEENVSKQFINDVEFTNNLSKSLSKPIKDNFFNLFKSYVLPSFEQSCQKMFQQINDSFDKNFNESFKVPFSEFHNELLEKAFQKFGSNNVNSNNVINFNDEKEKIILLFNNEKFHDAFTIILNFSNIDLLNWSLKFVDLKKVIFLL
jgi:hypothetical protein